ncbi:MAG: ABC transporter permease, partial [Bryobacteraceae bacterium]|nr:ABC transporter permease [Bryobacteraceae bacterium]
MSFWYDISTSAALALDSIRAHKLRSFLTLLGVIIGVASVILVGAAIDGLGVYAEGITAKQFGTESFLVAQVAQVGNQTRKQVIEKQKRNRRMQREEVDFLRTAAGEDILYSPYTNRVEDVKGEGQSFEGASIIGCSYTLPEIREVPVQEGRFFTENEERLNRPVAVVGVDIRDALYGGASPLGKKLRFGGFEFTVVGLLDKQGSNFGRSLDTPIYIPMSVYTSMFGKRGFAIFGKSKEGSGLTLEEGLDTTRAALRAKFHTPPGETDNFDVLTPESIRGFVDQILGVIAAVVVP